MHTFLPRDMDNPHKLGARNLSNFRQFFLHPLCGRCKVGQGNSTYYPLLRLAHPGRDFHLHIHELASLHRIFCHHAFPLSFFRTLITSVICWQLMTADWTAAAVFKKPFLNTMPMETVSLMARQGDDNSTFGEFAVADVARQSTRKR